MTSVSSCSGSSVASAYTPAAETQQQKQTADNQQAQDTVQLSPTAQAVLDGNHGNSGY